MTKKLKGKVKKGWGYEEIWVTNDNYCSKFMVFKNKGSKFSMHFHKSKEETWFIQSGSFLLRYMDTTDAKIYEKILKTGSVWHNPPMLPHQLEALEDKSTVLEVSTADSVEDNYRILPGDSQK